MSPLGCRCLFALSDEIKWATIDNIEKIVSKIISKVKVKLREVTRDT
jgi:hypothetical protein